MHQRRPRARGSESARPEIVPRAAAESLSPSPYLVDLPAVRRRRSTPAPAVSDERVRAHGKFLFVGDEKLYVRGVTYGTFRPGPDGEPYPAADAIERDLARMAASGIGAIRTYTAPPPRLLDAARDHGVRVLVGLAWEQHVAFLDEPGLDDEIVARVTDRVRAIAGHPAILGWAIGNEIPAPIVRWHGPRRIEGFLRRLSQTVRGEDPEGLVTYVNYPTTEYLHLPFLDFVCFNVFLERQEEFRRYLGRLHHVAGDRPLLLTEIGLDSRSHGREAQARSVEWQVRTAFAGGCAGTFVFAWTDEWHRGGHDVVEWEFGLTDRQRRPKPSLEAVRNAFEEVPFPPGIRWPSVSVVVCSHNGSGTIRDTLDALAGIDYPELETIVIDDGSTDATAAIVEEYDVRLIRTENRGLSNARNAGLEAATGEIVAYIDDDAYPDPDWLTYLAAAFMGSPHAAVGGPNITPPEDGPIAACVANAPGGPIHVLVSDLEAEHIPGCNMAFRREALEAAGGFDPRFRTAGDDVDVCWRLQDTGETLGFVPAAVVWHHRRPSIRAYWKQQVGYGRAEALLEDKWPHRYNRPGHLTWSGRLYADGYVAGWRRGRIYQGVWGSALFQSVYEPAPNLAWSLPAMPEWYLGTAVFAGLSALGLLWSPLLWALPLLALGLVVPLLQAAIGGARATFPARPRRRATRALLRAATAGLHVVQPLARLCGRLRHGLTPWRRRRGDGLAMPRSRTWSIWCETWRDLTSRLHDLERALRRHGALPVAGGAWDRWDLEIRTGTLGSVRLRSGVEEHGHGRQLVRFRAWPRVTRVVAIATALFAGIATAAALDGAHLTAAILLAAAIALLGGALFHAGSALSTTANAIEGLRADTLVNGTTEPEREA